jgi:phosphodiesterase/alkaline phosphatase D-like protein
LRDATNRLRLVGIAAAGLLAVATLGPIAPQIASGQPAPPVSAPTETPVPNWPPSTAPFAYGVAAGDMTVTSAVLWTRTPGEADVTAELATTPGFERATSLPPAHTTAASDFTTRVTAANLTPGTLYYYRFRSGGDTSPVGTFRSAYAPTQDATVTLAFSGDAHWSWKPYPLINSLLKEPLDTFIFLGDLLYESRNLETGKNGTIAAESLDDFRLKYRENREPRPGSSSSMTPMLDLYRMFGQYSVVDNHETANSRVRGAPPYITGGATAGGTFVNQSEGFRNRIQAYSEYQPVADATVNGTGDARLDGTTQLYRATPWGANVDLIVLDDRSYRDAAIDPTSPQAFDCARTMLGAPQLAWFEKELQSAQARKVAWKVVVISSPIAEYGKAWDSSKWWVDYRCERDRMLKFIDDNKIDNVVFLTTDNHDTTVNNLEYYSIPGDPTSPLKPARNAFEMLTGPLGADVDPIDVTHNVDVYGLSQRDADRRVVDTWNGDIADSKGKYTGLKQDGFDPIGLEPSFPGLVASSVRAAGMPAGQIIPADFVSFKTFSYAVLRFDRTSLTVRVMSIPAVLDPTFLFDPVEEQAYESRQATETLSFQLRAQ